jgi:hypothetical protein|tara:strand:+ start:1045 stop:1710 length:666 start_codon:yes stop_codon:yes gene_type:complete
MALSKETLVEMLKNEYPSSYNAHKDRLNEMSVKEIMDMFDFLDRVPRVNKKYGTDEEDFLEEDESESVMELMRDQGIPYGEQVKKKQATGIMASADMAGADPLLLEEYEKYRYDMLEQGLEPMSFEDFKRDAMFNTASAPDENIGPSAKAIDPTIRIQDVVEEFIREKGRKPNSLEELKEFYELKIGTASNPNMDVVKELVEEDKEKITLASGGLANILGV